MYCFRKCCVEGIGRDAGKLGEPRAYSTPLKGHVGNCLAGQYERKADEALQKLLAIPEGEYVDEVLQLRAFVYRDVATALAHDAPAEGAMERAVAHNAPQSHEGAIFCQNAVELYNSEIKNGLGV